MRNKQLVNKDLHLKRKREWDEEDIDANKIR